MIFKMDAAESKAANILISIGCYIAFVSGIMRDGEAMLLLALFLTFAGLIPYVHSLAGSLILGCLLPFIVFSFAREDMGLFFLLAGLYIWLWRHTPVTINLALAALVAVFLLKGYPLFDDTPHYDQMNTEPSEAYMHGRAAVALTVFGSLFAIALERWWKKRDDLNY